MGLRSFTVFPATGGLDTTQPPGALKPDQLITATNVEYDTGGSRKKRGGTARYNAAQLTEAGSAISITALSDFWRYGTSLTPTQKYVATAGTQVWKSDADGVWDSIGAGWGTNTAQVGITIAQGYAVFSNNQGQNPKRWDQTTFADLTATGHPRFESSVYHLRRLWAVGNQTTPAGAAGNPSAVYVTAAGDITDFTGADTTSLIFSEDDGDRVMGTSRPFRNRLYVFKGPNMGSIHEVTGATLSAFARNEVAKGAPLISFKTLVTTENDIFWMSLAGIHSLVTTQKYGDTEAAIISAPIQATFRNLTSSSLANAVGFAHPARNIVGWFVPTSDAGWAPPGGSALNYLGLIYNYLRGAWSLWSVSNATLAALIPVTAAAVMRRDAGTPTGVPTLFLGTNAGYVLQGDQSTRNDDNGAMFSCTMATSVMMELPEKPPTSEASFHSVTTYFVPTANTAANIYAAVDGRIQAFTVSMTGSGRLAYVDTPIDDKGRSLYLAWDDGLAVGKNIDLVGFSLRYSIGEHSAIETTPVEVA